MNHFFPNASAIMINYLAFYIINALFFLISYNIPAQGIHENQKVNCDSLITVMSNESGFIDKYPAPVKPYSEILNGFMSKFKSGGPERTIYVLVVVDTLGNVKCPKILKGINTGIDSIALRYIASVKFTPAEYRGKKKAMPVAMPLFGSYISEARGMKKVNGRWIMKDEHK